MNSQLIEPIARVAHEANRAYCKTLGDESHQSWDDTPEFIRASTRAGVKAKLERPAISSKESHQAWMNYKLAEGWRYGPVKDLELRTHPNLVAYGELPLAERRKDVLFGAVVVALSIELERSNALTPEHHQHG